MIDPEEFSVSRDATTAATNDDDGNNRNADRCGETDSSLSFCVTTGPRAARLFLNALIGLRHIRSSRRDADCTNE